MAKADFKQTVWTKTVGDQHYEKTATSIDDEVQYRFDGWLPKDAKAEAANAAAAVKTSDAGASAGADAGADKAKSTNR